MKKKFLATFFGALGYAALSLGLLCGVNANIARAEEDYQSVGDRYIYSTSGKVESFLNKKAVTSSYKGVRTEITNLTSGEDFTAYYNGLVSPVATNKAVVYYDMENANPDAEAFIYTYTLAKDRSKQVSIVSVYRSGGYYFSVALTDEIEIRDGYAYLAGTDQKTVGLASASADAAYTSEGFWSQNGRDLQHLVATNGNVYISSTSVAANIKSEAFLTAAKENLAGTKYESLYTAEYVNDMITAFGSGAGNNTAILSITYKNVKRESVAFHLRGISGQWIGDAGGVAPWNGGNTYGFALQKTNVIYKNVPVKLEDLFTLHTIYVADGATAANPFGVGFYNTDAAGSGGTWFKIENGKGVISGGYAAEYKATETGKFYVSMGAYVGSNYSALGSWSPKTVFEFEVISGDPVISGKDGAVSYKGMTYDLSAFFDTWYLGKAENANFAYKIDGAICADGKLIADGADHTAELTISDEYGNVGTGVAEIKGAEINLEENVSIAPFKGKATVLPVPYVKGGAGNFVQYSLKITDESGKLITTDSVYTFTENGTYNVEYTFTADGADKMVKNMRLTVDILPLIPEIEIDGEYSGEYFTGHTLKILAATAQDEIGDTYAVIVTLKNGAEKISLKENQAVLEKSGTYTVTYVCEYAAGKSVSLSREFSVVKDNISPEIVVEGAYETSYEYGTVIRLCGFSVSDNSEEIAFSGVKVYLNGAELALDNGLLRLTKSGKYEIVYYASDLSGNSSEVKFAIELSGEEEEDKGCGSVLSAVAPLNVLIACVLLIVRRKKRINRNIGTGD